MNIREKILVIEDEKSIARFISTILTANGYEAMRAASGAEAMSMISSHCPDLVILDLGLPDMDGLDILRQLRSWSTLPVVVVSARHHEHDKVEALDYGADDYISKPFGTSELLARIRTAIRHTRTTLSNTQIAQSGKFVTGDLTIDYDKHQVLMHGENAGLTVNEYKIVALLGKYAGKVLTTTSSSASCGAPRPRPTTRSFASTWPISAARWKKIPAIPSISLPRWAWAIACGKAIEPRKISSHENYIIWTKDLRAKRRSFCDFVHK